MGGERGRAWRVVGMLHWIDDRAKKSHTWMSLDKCDASQPLITVAQ